MSDVQPANRVLFVCRGNLCRSPMAMALLRHRLAEVKGHSVDSVESAGYFDWGAFPREAHAFARRAVERLCGADVLADHVARRWDGRMVARATLVVVAEQWMLADFPVEKVLTLREFGEESGDVDDPYGRDYPEFVDCARTIDRLLSAGMWRLSDCRWVT